MIVHWIAAAQALGYLSAVPVHLALSVRYDDGLRCGVGVSAFDARAARRRAERRKPRRRSGGAPDARAIWRVLRRAKTGRMNVVGVVAMGDAALTAMACGLLVAAASAAPWPGRRRIDPDFSAGGLRLRLRASLRFTAGQLAMAALKAVLDR